LLSTQMTTLHHHHLYTQCTPQTHQISIRSLLQAFCTACFWFSLTSYFRVQNVSGSAHTHFGDVQRHFGSCHYGFWICNGPKRAQHATKMLLGIIHLFWEKDEQGQRADKKNKVAGTICTACYKNPMLT